MHVSYMSSYIEIVCKPGSRWKLSRDSLARSLDLQKDQRSSWPVMIPPARSETRKMYESAFSTIVTVMGAGLSRPRRMYSWIVASYALRRISPSKYFRCVGRNWNLRSVAPSIWSSGKGIAGKYIPWTNRSHSRAAFNRYSLAEHSWNISPSTNVFSFLPLRKFDVTLRCSSTMSLREIRDRSSSDRSSSILSRGYRSNVVHSSAPMMRCGRFNELKSCRILRVNSANSRLSSIVLIAGNFRNRSKML